MYTFTGNFDNISVPYKQLLMAFSIKELFLMCLEKSVRSQCDFQVSTLLYCYLFIITFHAICISTDVITSKEDTNQI